MASKFGKILTFTALVSAATAGALYYLHTRSEQAFDDFDDFDDDSDTVPSDDAASREYVPLDLSAEAAKEAKSQAPLSDVESKVKETLEDAKDAAKSAADQTKDLAKELAGQTKDLSKEVAGDVKDAASGMKDILSEAEVFQFEDKKK